MTQRERELVQRVREARNNTMDFECCTICNKAKQAEPAGFLEPPISMANVIRTRSSRVLDCEYE